MLVGAVIVEWWWVWKDCQSLLMCPLHQQTLHLHVAWEEKHFSHSLHSPTTPFFHSRPYSIVFSCPSPRRGWNFPSSRKETTTILSIALISSHTGFSFGFCACSELEERPQGHDFCYVCEIAVVFIHDSSLLLV